MGQGEGTEFVEERIAAGPVVFRFRVGERVRQPLGQPFPYGGLGGVGQGEGTEFVEERIAAGPVVFRFRVVERVEQPYGDQADHIGLLSVTPCSVTPG